MIEFKEKQAQNSQTCGGYSLAAVLVEMRKTNKAIAEIEAESISKHQGMTIYNKIQTLQNESGITNGLLQDIHRKGRCLPSFICQVAREYGLTKLEVHCSHATLCKAFTSHLSTCTEAEEITKNVIEEEAGRIGRKIVTDSTADIKGEIGFELGVYYIVLVNNAEHWVVVQQDATGLHVYDPAGNMDNIIGVRSAFSGLYIKF